MRNKLFDKEVNEVVVVFKWITAKRFRLCHTLAVAPGLKGGDTVRGRSFGVVDPGPDTNQGGQVLHRGEQMKWVHLINQIYNSAAHLFV